jgi:hypothetical protein
MCGYQVIPIGYQAEVPMSYVIDVAKLKPVVEAKNVIIADDAPVIDKEFPVPDCLKAFFAEQFIGATGVYLDRCSGWALRRKHSDVDEGESGIVKNLMRGWRDAFKQPSNSDICGWRFAEVFHLCSCAKRSVFLKARRRVDDNVNPSSLVYAKGFLRGPNTGFRIFGSRLQLVNGIRNPLN